MGQTTPRLLVALRQLLRLGTFVALAGLIAEFGFPIDERTRSYVRIAQLCVVGLFTAHSSVSLWLAGDRRAHVRAHWLELALLSLILLDLGLALFFHRSALVASAWFHGVQIYIVLQSFLGVAHVQESLTRQSVRPALLLSASFCAVALAGAGLLMSPLARTPGAAPWNFTDAFFTAASAVCVTGLAVRDVGSELSFRGQAVLLGLVQVGGLGVVLLACGASVLERGRLRVRELNVVAEAMGISAPGRLRRFLLFVLTFTLSCELLGAAALWLATRGEDLGGHGRLWWSVFHSVSAFCNAGFSLSAHSLIPWADRPAIVITIGLLIILGGLGFAVHMDVLARRPSSLEFLRWLRWRLSESAWWPWRHRVFDTPLRQRLSLDSRLVLSTTCALIVLGAVLFFASEATSGLARMGAGESWLASFFQSVTARTAGFNTVDTTKLELPTLLVLIPLMVVGASPLSTGGGMRTTTLAVAFLTVRAMLRNREQVEAFGRSVSRSVVNACITIAVMYMSVLALVTAALLATQEGIAFEGAIFECVSALSTVGLSLGVTPTLDTTGRWIIAFAMIAGRIGPLAVLWSFRARPRPLRYQFPEEPVVIA